MPATRAVFIDRDGTLNEMVYDGVHGLLDSPRKPDQVALIPFAGEFLKGLGDLGYFRIIATNQPGIAKGTLSLDDLEAVNRRLLELVSAAGGGWDDFMFSPYHPSGGPWARPEYVKQTECRKPGPGMLLAAAQKHGLALTESWMVGDGLVDVQAGRAAGCRTLLVTKLKISQVEQFFEFENARPDAIAGNLREALEIIAGRRPPGRQRE